MNTNLEPQFISARGNILRKIVTEFQNKALEGHIFGSEARGEADAYSDLDVWFTFSNERIAEVLEKRREYFSAIGEIIHICEAPQNSPSNGKYSFVLYQTDVGLLQVDYDLCPKSTSFITKDSKRLCGDLELPAGEIGLNPQKVIVDSTYRLDFLILIIFTGIKGLARKKESALDYVFKEYDLLNKYSIPIEPIKSRNVTFQVLRQIMTNVFNISNGRQKAALSKIEAFSNQVESNL
ncbi:MAG: nucleotidyltransferase domain-containing protein [Patescibacteria group bacterium]